MSHKAAESAGKMPLLLEAIRRCHYCGREMMEIAPLSYLENPFCAVCFPERLAKMVRGFCGWAILGDYAYPIWEAKNHGH